MLTQVRLSPGKNTLIVNAIQVIIAMENSIQLNDDGRTSVIEPCPVKMIIILSSTKVYRRVITEILIIVKSISVIL
jgi:hypothetical protein